MNAHDEALIGSVARPEEPAGAAFASRLLRFLLPPMLCFVLARVLLHWAARSTNRDPFAAITWARWDSTHYLSIADNGYEVFSCALLRGYDPHDWCGNTAWLPGYPVLVKLLAKIAYIQVDTAGVLISSAFALAALIVVWVLFLRAELTTGNVLVLLLAALFPGHVYDHAVFPISQFAFFQLLSLWFYGKKRLELSALCAALAAFTYSSGLFLCGAFALHALLLERKKPLEIRLKELALPCAGVLVGFSAALALQWLQTGFWNGYFLVQAKYAYSPRLPFEMWGNCFAALLSDWPRISGRNEQVLFVAVLCVLMFANLLRQRGVSRMDGALAAFAVVYWLVPIMLGGQLALYRAEATLLPAIPLARKLPWPLLSLLVFAAAVLARVMAPMFFDGSLT